MGLISRENVSWQVSELESVSFLYHVLTGGMASDATNYDKETYLKKKTEILVTTAQNRNEASRLRKCNHSCLYGVILSVLDPRKCEYLKDYSLDFEHAYMTTYLAS